MLYLTTLALVTVATAWYATWTAANHTEPRNAARIRAFKSWLHAFKSHHRSTRPAAL